MQITTRTFSFQEIDKFCDYVPFVSTATNLVYLFIQHVYSTETTAAPAEEAQPRYWTYILEKSPQRCAVALIPVFGNISLIFYDVYNSVTALLN